MTTSPWVGIRWVALGLFALLAGVVLFLAAARAFNVWLYAGKYVAAELEVTRFQPQAGPKAQGRLIEGVIHPSEEPIQTNDSHIAVRQFVDPNDVTGRRVPWRSELEGRRLAVLHWPQHAAVKRWWHPPTVVMLGATKRGGVGACEALLGCASFGAGLFCLRRGFRHFKATESPELDHEANRDL